MDLQDLLLEILSETNFLTNSTMKHLNDVKDYFYVILAVNYAISPLIQVPFLIPFRYW